MISYPEAMRLDRERLAGMTLGEALDLLRTPPWACACIGRPGCCIDRYAQAHALQRGAHITARLITDYTRKATP